MVVKTLIKQSFVSIKQTFNRFISILVIVLLGVGFFTGIRETSPNMKDSLDAYFKKENVYDISLMSTWGITDDEINDLKNKGYNVEGSYSFDTLIHIDDDYVAKVHSYDKNATMNKLVVIEGRLPHSNNECVIEKNKDVGHYKLGDKITIDDDILKEKELTIVGFVKSPLYVSLERGSTKLLNGKVNFYMYSLITNFDSDVFTEAYIDLNIEDSTFSDKYISLRDSEVKKLENISDEYRDKRFNDEKNDALKELNDNIEKYNKEKEDTYKKLDDALDKINKTEKELKSNLTKLNNNEKKAKTEFANKKKELNNNKKEVENGISELKKNISYMESVGMDTTKLKVQLSNLEKTLTTINNGYNTLLKKETKTYNDIKSGKAKIENAKKKLESSKVELADNRKKADTEFEDAYKKIEDARKEIDELEKPEWYVLDLDSNLGYYQFSQDSERIAKIAKVFPVLFYLVAILVSLTTMTRMVEEERSELGTLKSLGYEDNQILFKYMLYALLASVIGSILGVIIGTKTIPKIIYGMYCLMYTLGEFVSKVDLVSYLIGTFIAIGCIMLSTYLAVKKSLKEVPAELLRPKSPKAGKRVLLERIPFIWNRLSFSRKVTVRNVFRYKKRFLMTILGISGCTGLIIAGFGLQDCIIDMVPNQYEKIFSYDLEITFDKDNKNINKDYEEISKFKEFSKTLKADKDSIELTNIDTNQTIQIIIPFEDYKDFIQIKNRRTNEYYDLNDKVIVSEKLYKLLKLKNDDELDIKLNDNTYKTKVGGSTENYIMHYIYMSKKEYNSDSFNTMFVKINNLTEESRNALSKKLKEYDSVSKLTYNSLSRSIFDDAMKNLGSITIILIVSAGLLAFVVLYNLSNINISERKRELASIKVLGFYDSEVYKYVSRENTILTVIGMTFGCLIGYVLTMYLIKTCEFDITMFSPKISIYSYIYSLLITLGFTILVNIATYFALKKIKMVESLKSVE